MINKIPPELIARYLQGTCSQEEDAIINEWYDAYDAAIDPLTTLNADEQLLIKQLMYGRIKARVRAVESRRPSVLKRLLVYTDVAAFLLLLLGIPLLLNIKKNDPVVKRTKPVAITNNTMGIMKQLLPDSSMVWLQPHAGISYTSSEQREVRLNGDAFFDIAKDAAHPFVVYSGTMVTRVLGTSFYIRNSRKQEVTVLSGKVAVHMEALNGEIILLPQQKATLSTGTYQLVKEAVTEKDLWQQHNISFDNVTVKEVVDTLNKVFNTRILLEDEALGNYLFKADFTGQNLPAILEIMEQSLEVRYEIKNNEIILKHQH